MNAVLGQQAALVLGTSVTFFPSKPHTRSPVPLASLHARCRTTWPEEQGPERSPWKCCLCLCIAEQSVPHCPPGFFSFPLLELLFEVSVSTLVT